MKKAHVVIVGGGFAGLQLARRLSRSHFTITLIDKQNHHQFQPLFYQVASAGLEPSSISFPFRKVFQGDKDVHIRMTEVKTIVPEAKKVLTADGEFKYDYLVIATGCTTNFFGNEQIAAHALPMKTTEEAIQIRNRILTSFESYFSADDKQREALMNIVMVGAGPTGVELSGAFAEMRNRILPKDYPDVDFSKLKIYLLEGSPYALNAMSDVSKKSARSYLEGLGVIVKTDTVVKSYDGEKVCLTNGEEICCANLIWSAGVIGNVIQGIEAKDLVRNRYVVNRYNQLRNHSEIFAIGDIAYMETPLFPKGHPQVANVAINQGKLLAANMEALVKGQSMEEYEYKDLGSMATIGRHKAVVEFPFMKLQGYWAWFIWMFLHLMLILGVRNKLVIFINWGWKYLVTDSSLRLILKRNNTD